MPSLPQVASALQTVLTDMSDEVARTTGYCQRHSKFHAAAFVQTLVLGWWQAPDASLSELCQTAAVRGVPITPQGLDQRFTEAGATLLGERLATALGQVLTAEPVAQEVLARFPAVAVLDSTTITLPDALASVWPGCGGRVATGTQAALKVTVRLDLVGGGLEAELGAGRAQDRATALQHAPVPAGALRIADQGFWSLPVLAGIADQGGYFLSRYHRQTTVLVDDVPVDLPRWLAAQATPVVDAPVTLGREARLPVRLLAIRVPQAVADQRRRQLRAAARRDGKTASAQALALAAWTLLVTNAPAALLSVPEAEVLRRVRWQIELLFKLWKQHGRLATSRSAQPWRILCEVYAKLLAVLLQHGILLLGGWDFPTRSLVKAAMIVRAAVLLLAVALDDPTTLLPILARLQGWLAGAGRIANRRKRPSTAQLLADPTLLCLA